MSMQFIDRLDEALYNKWSIIAHNLLATIESGLQKFGANPAPEIIQLQNLIQEAKIETDRKKLLKKIKSISTRIDQLYSNKEANLPVINNFLYESRRSLALLRSSLKTENAKYLNAIANPSGKKSENISQPGILKNAALQVGANQIVDMLLSSSDQNIIAPVQLQIAAIPNNQEIVFTDRSKRTSPPLIEGKMGTQNYQQAKSRSSVEAPDQAFAYLGEQVYGATFEFYYTHVATLLDMIDKINLLSEASNTTAEMALKKEAMLKSCGIKELNTPEGYLYLDTMAQALGFKDAVELQTNYKQLDTPQGFEEFKKKKFGIMQAANDEAMSLENDPIEKLAQLNIAEKKRLQEKIADPLFAQESAAYAHIISYSATDMMSKIRSAQKMRNLGQILATDHLATEPGAPKDQSTFQYIKAKAFDFAMNQIDLKSYLDSALQRMSGLTAAANYERDLVHMSDPVNKAWTTLIHQKAEEDLERVQKLLQDSTGAHYNQEVLIKNYTISLQSYLHSEKQLQDMKNTLAPGAIKTNQILQKEQAVNALKKQTDTLSQIIGYKLTSDTRAQTPAALLDNIQRQDGMINALKQAAKDKNTQISNQITKIRDYEASEPLARGFDKFMGIFGVKTAHALNRENISKQNNQQLQNLVFDLEAIQIETNIQTDLQAYAQQQVNIYNDHNLAQPLVLLQSMNTLLEEYTAAYQQMQDLYSVAEPNENISLRILSSRTRFEEAEGKLQVALLALGAKLDDPAIAQTFAQSTANVNTLQGLTTAIQQFDKNIDPRMLGRTNDAQSPLTSPLNQLNNALSKMVTENQKIEQQKLIEQAKKAVTDQLKDKSLLQVQNPYQFVLTTNVNILAGLTTENRSVVFDHIEKEYLNMITSQSDTLDRKLLERISFSLQSAYYQQLNVSSDSVEDQQMLEHYKTLSNTVMQLADLKFAAIAKLPFTQLQTQMGDLDAEYIHLIADLDNAKKKTDAVQNTFASWLWNPLNLRDPEELTKAQAFELASGDRLTQFEARYANVLESYSSTAPSLYPAMDYQELISTIAHLQSNQLVFEQQLVNNPAKQNNPAFMKILITTTNLIEQAQASEARHVQRQIPVVQSTLARLQNNAQKLNSDAKYITQNMIKTNEFDDDLYQDFQAQLSQINQEIDKIDLRIKSIDTNIIAQADKYNQLGKPTLTSWEKEKKEMQEQLSALRQTVQSNTAKYEASFQLYSDIINNKTVTMPAVPKEALGKALLLAINHKNDAMVTATLNEHGTKLDSQDLGLALKALAAQGSLASVSQILTMRNDVALTTTLLTDSMQAAYTAGHPQVANFILLNTSIDLNEESIKMLQDNLKPVNPKISNVEQSYAARFTGLVVGNDDDTNFLIEMRKGYLAQQTLLESLQGEFQEIQAQNSEEKTKQFLDKLDRIGQATKPMKDFYADKHFENILRKNGQVKKWDAEINQIVAGYTNAFAPPQAFALQAISEQFMESDPLSHPIPMAKPIAHGFQNVARKPEQSPFELASNKLNLMLGKMQYDQSNLISVLSELRDEGSPQAYSQVLSKSINKAAQENQYESLGVLLDHANPENVQEYSFNALTEAMRAGQANAIEVLLKRGAAIGKEQEVFDALDKTSKESSNLDRNIHFNKIASLILRHVSPPFDQRVQNMTDKIASNGGPSTISPATVGQGMSQKWFSDVDGPFINNIRNAYIFTENQYNNMNSTVYKELQDIEEMDEETLQQLPPEQLLKLFNRVNATQISVQQQLAVLDAYKNDYKDHVVDKRENLGDGKKMNHKRLGEQIMVWEKQLEQKGEFLKDIQEVKAKLMQHPNAATVAKKIPVLEERSAPKLR